MAELTFPKALFARYTASTQRNMPSSFGGGKSFLDQAAATRYIISTILSKVQVDTHPNHKSQLLDIGSFTIHQINQWVPL
jgi:hypothetical protein